MTTWHIFRPFEFEAKFVNKVISTFKAGAGFEKNGTAERQASKLRVRLMPVWVQGASNTRKPTPDLIVLHRSASNKVGECVPTWTKTGPHYFICQDGQICKMVQDNQMAWHAGNYLNETKNSWWRIPPRGNIRSIGIELVNGDIHGTDPITKTSSPVFTEAQYQALIWLLGELIRRFGIPRYQIVAHTDVSPFDPVRQKDPGPSFQWKRLENEDLGMRPLEGYMLTPDDYGGYFSIRRNGILRPGNSDVARKFGGEINPLEDRPESFPKPQKRSAIPPLTVPVLHQPFVHPFVDIRLKLPEGGLLDPRERPAVKGNPITELQDDLIQIGYDLVSGKVQPKTTGVFDENTRVCVKRFQQHFFTFDRLLASADGRVNRMTAEWIKKVRKGLESAGAISPTQKRP
ncbi:MAG: N-acetylmuramoyl-L-alanine amidase [Methylococcales bacterium]